ncbi:hypothetical protein CHS0354_031251, partial [Potamilus streckersoni]
MNSPKINSKVNYSINTELVKIKKIADGVIHATPIINMIGNIVQTMLDTEQNIGEILEKSNLGQHETMLEEVEYTQNDIMM